jgi:hypothetical protein
VRFFVGLHHPHVAGNFDAAFISVNTIRDRKSPFPAKDWIMDSGAFTTIQKNGGYPHPVSEYADQIRRWKDNGNLLAAVSQDYMCEAHMLERTGLTVEEHQRLTIERYDALLAEDTGVYIMPVLQGYTSKEYVSHIRQYGDRLKPGMWVGVGSVCKRNGNPSAIWWVLSSIKDERPDLLLHGFGLKKTSLKEPLIRQYLHSADSMAWSFAARREGRNANDWREAKAFIEDIATAIWASTNPRQPYLLCAS